MSIFKTKIFLIIISLSLLLSVFSSWTFSNDKVSISSDLPDNVNLTINFVLPDYIYLNKEDLFNDFFYEFYSYIVSKKDGAQHLSSYNIKNVDDLYAICKNWDNKSGVGFPIVGNALGKYFLTQKIGSNFVEQKQFDTFLGYCLNNNKFLDFLYFDKTFFYHFRLDEGYTGSLADGKDPYDSDFFASTYASIIDTAKFFYYTKDSLPTYLVHKKNIPKLYDIIPGVLTNNFNESISISYNTKNNVPFTLPDDYNCYGFKFAGYYTEPNFSSDSITHIDNDFIINNNLLKEQNYIMLYAKFERYGVFAEELLSDFPDMK